MSKMLDEAIEDYLKNMRLNINFFISFLDKNSYKKVGKIPTFYFFTNIYQMHFLTYHSHFFLRNMIELIFCT